MARGKGRFVKFMGLAAIAGAAVGYFKLKKEADEKESTVIDVAKEKVDGLIESVKGQELANKADATVEKITEFANKRVEKIKSSDAIQKASQFAEDLKDKVADIFDLEDEDAVPVDQEKDQ